MQTCNIETSISDNQQTVIWDPSHPVTPQYWNVIQGKPICLDEFKLPLTRKCENSQWTPLEVPSCNYVQTAFEDESVLCPPNYKHLALPSSRKTICVLVTEPQPWRNVCLTDGAFTTFYELSRDDEKKAVLTFLQANKIKQVWMPAKRSTKYGSVMWALGSELNGETLEFDDLGISVNDRGNIVEDGCFSAIVAAKLKIGSIGSCATEMPILCIYREHEEEMVQLACPEDSYTIPFRGQQQQCYSKHHILPGSTPKPEVPVSGPSRTRMQRENIDLSDKNWIALVCQGGNLMTMNSSMKVAMFRQIASQTEFPRNDHCLFAVTEGNTYVTDRSYWVHIAKDVPYVNWHYPLRDGMYLTTDINGKWNWIGESFTCVLCERTVDLQTPVMVLNFDQAKGRLYLIVYSEEFLWRRSRDENGFKCFTNADYDLVKTVKVLNKIWSGILNADESVPLGENDQPRTILKTIYELKLYGDGPGHYWCRGHAIPDFRPIDAPKIVAYRHLKGDVFATLINTACQKCEELYMKKHIRDLAREFREFLRSLYRNVKQFFHYKISIENVRVMQIDEIQSKRSARILFHISVSTSYDFDNAENILNIPVNQFRIYKIKQILEQVLSTAKSPKFTYLSVNSTEYCLPGSLKSTNNPLNWISASIGEITAPRELCLLSNGLPVLRQCVGDFIYGGVWHNLTRQQCHSNISDITRQLYQLDRTLSQSNETHEVIKSLAQLFQNSNREKFVPADLFYLGRLMHTIFQLSSNSTNTTTPLSPLLPSSSSTPLSLLLNKTHTESIFSIYNSLMFLNENTTRISAALNSTNILLDAFDNIINGIPMDLTSHRNNLIVNLDYGTIAAQTPKLIVYVIDPVVRNVSGIALIKRTDAERGDRGDFTDYTVRLLYANQSSSGLLAEPNLEIAAFVPRNLLDRLNETHIMNDETIAAEEGAEPMPTTEPLPAVRIVITVYYNDLLFQEYKNVTHAKSAGKIISVSIPGYGPDLPALMPIYVKSRNYTTEHKKMCGYWNFRYTNGWSHDGCEYGGSSNTTVGSDPVVLCACSHLTHFSFLVLGTYVHTIRNEDDVVKSEAHSAALDMITLLGCSLSLLGIFGIAVTALVFRSWREKPSSKVLLQLSGAVGLQMVLLCFINTENSAMQLVLDDKWLACVALGASLHYSILVAFSWMLITAYLQFMRYVKVLGQTRASRFFFKSFLVGWMIPLIPVLLVIAIAPHSYVQGIKNTNSGICYPSGLALYLGVVLPIGVIILANLIIFLLVIYNILYGPCGKLRSNERDLTLSQLRLSVFLFFLLGLTWIFGFLASTKAGLVFSYFFCLTATIQGFVLFVYFIILDPGTRKLWRNFFANYICCWCYGKTEYYK